jgi:hypothetical protein
VGRNPIRLSRTAASLSRKLLHWVDLAALLETYMIFPNLESAVNAQEAASHCSNGQDAAPASELKTPPLKSVGTPRIRRVYGWAIRRARIIRFPLARSQFRSPLSRQLLSHKNGNWARKILLRDLDSVFLVIIVLQLVENRAALFALLRPDARHEALAPHI